MSGLQEEEARKGRIAEKEMEIAKASSCLGNSFLSISPVWPWEDILTKVSGWMDKTGAVANLTESINASSVHAKSSVPEPVNAEKSVNERQFSAHTRDSKQPVQPTITTKAAVRDDGKTEWKLITYCAIKAQQHNQEWYSPQQSCQGPLVLVKYNFCLQLEVIWVVQMMYRSLEERWDSNSQVKKQILLQMRERTSTSNPACQSFNWQNFLVIHWSGQSGRNYFKRQSMQQTWTTVWNWITWKQWSRAKPRMRLLHWVTLLRCKRWRGTC